MCLLLEWEVCSSNLRLVKSDTVLAMACHCCGISLPAGAMPGRWASQTHYMLRLNAASVLDFRIKECYGEILGFEKSWYFTPEGWALMRDRLFAHIG